MSKYCPNIGLVAMIMEAISKGKEISIVHQGVGAWGRVTDKMADQREMYSYGGALKMKASDDFYSIRLLSPLLQICPQR